MISPRRVADQSRYYERVRAHLLWSQCCIWRLLVRIVQKVHPTLTIGAVLGTWMTCWHDQSTENSWPSTLLWKSSCTFALEPVLHLTLISQNRSERPIAERNQQCVHHECWCTDCTIVTQLLWNPPDRIQQITVTTNATERHKDGSDRIRQPLAVPCTCMEPRYPLKAVTTEGTVATVDIQDLRYFKSHKGHNYSHVTRLRKPGFSLRCSRTSRTSLNQHS